MKNSQNFWINEITNWEIQRYKGLFSKILYSSLHYRQNYLIFILSQIPEGSHVVEIGCGSGKLYDLLPNKNKIKYSGYDISPEAIKIAGEKHRASDNVQWHCIEAHNIKNIRAEYVVTAGLLDWLNDVEIESLLTKNNFTYHVHSFSGQSESWAKRVHKFFSFFVSKTKKIHYSPRVFTESQINKLCASIGTLKFVSHTKLSFGRFVHNLPPTISTEFSQFLAWKYFFNKKNKSNFFETNFKKIEADVIRSHSPDLAGKTVMEVGSGYGFYTRWLASQKPGLLVAMDPAVDTQYFFKSDSYKFINTKFEEFNSDQKFDVIFVLGVLEFVKDLDMFYYKLLSFCKKGSSVVLLIPDENSLSYWVYKKYHSRFQRQLSGKIESILTLSLNKFAKNHKILKIKSGFLNNLFIIKIDE